jgi:pyridoxal phosphate enzyme (YggS family)
MATIPTGLQARIHAVRERIARACAAAGRGPDSVRLLAVSKTFPAARVREAAAAGQRDFGENFAQEALDKIAALRDLRDLPLVWHFIGAIQSNKTRAIAEHFDWVHAVDRERIAQRLSAQRPAGRAPIDACIEVNLGGEATKSGVAPGEVASLARSMRGLPGLRLRGLMAIPEPSGDLAQQRRRFAQLRELKEALAREGLVLDTLSMGMSADFEAAIQEGATMVRVGTAIFGERTRG